MEQLLGGAREKGISDDEIGAVQLNVMMVSAGNDHPLPFDIIDNILSQIYPSPV
jgi:hypothetical protein